MRGGTALAIAAVVFGAACTAPARRAARQPNVVVFLVDDLGWQDVSQPFDAVRSPYNDRYRTPNLERLCREGMRFDQAYAHCVCTPSRVSLLTGSNPARHRVTHWTLRKDVPTDPERQGLHRPDWNGAGLDRSGTTDHAFTAPTLPARLRDLGYRTILAGKAHFGAIDTPGADPRTLGFDVNIAGHAAGAPSSYLAKLGFLRNPQDTIWQVPGLERWHGQDLFLTDVLTTEALAAAQDAVDHRHPFFLYLAHYAVHAPFDADERFAQKYRDAGLPEVEARYAALVEGMDDSLGRVLAWLDAEGIADDTLVVFASDNGGLSANARAGTPHTHNAPLKSGKGSAYEGGVRVPFAVRWPGRVAAAAVSHLPLILDDLFPTVCDLVGADPRCPDGTSCAPTLLGAAQPTHPLVWHSPHFWGANGPGIEPYSAVRDGDLKLIWFYGPERAELYDVRHDVGESHDLAGERPADAARLRALLRTRLVDVRAQVPTRADGTACALP